MAIIHGRNLIVSLGGRAVAGARSCDVNVSADDIEISTATQGQWRNFIAGRKEWSVTCNMLVQAVKTNVAMVGQTVTLSFGVRGSSTDRVSGTAIIKSWRVTGTVGNLAQGVFSFRGSGPLQ